MLGPENILKTGFAQKGLLSSLCGWFLFFCPTPCGSRQVVYQTGKTIALCKFTELKQWQHQSWRQSAYKRELNWIGTSMELSPCNQKSKQSKSPKPNKHTKTPKQTTNKKPARSVVSWSVHRLLKRTRRDDNIVSPQGLVWHRNQERNNKPQRGHTVICEPGSNKSTERKPRLPPARSLEITESWKLLMVALVSPSPFWRSGCNKPDFDFAAEERSSGPSKSWRRHFSNSFFWNRLSLP